MARTLPLKAFWCTAALTGFLFLVKAGVLLALRAYYRPTLEHAYNDILALREVSTLGILQELDPWITFLLFIGLIATALLGGAVVVLRRSWRPARVVEKTSHRAEANWSR
jgi:hypothetical protein